MGKGNQSKGYKNRIGKENSGKLKDTTEGKRGERRCDVAVYILCTNQRKRTGRSLNCVKNATSPPPSHTYTHTVHPNAAETFSTS